VAPAFASMADIRTSARIAAAVASASTAGAFTALESSSPPLCPRITKYVFPIQLRVNYRLAATATKTSTAVTKRNGGAGGEVVLVLVNL